MTLKNSNSGTITSDRRSLRSAVIAALTVIGFALTVAIGTASQAGASTHQETPTTEPAAQPGSTTTVVLSNEKETESLGSSLPGVDSGHKPTYQGDRGTWPQYVLMAGMIIVLASFVLFFRRDMRKARAAKSASTSATGPAGNQG